MNLGMFTFGDATVFLFHHLFWRQHENLILQIYRQLNPNLKINRKVLQKNYFVSNRNNIRSECQTHKKPINQTHEHYFVCSNVAKDLIDDPR